MDEPGQEEVDELDEQIERMVDAVLAGVMVSIPKEMREQYAEDLEEINSLMRPEIEEAVQEMVAKFMTERLPSVLYTYLMRKVRIDG